MEARQRVELTGTNKPRGLALSFLRICGGSRGSSPWASTVGPVMCSRSLCGSRDAVGPVGPRHLHRVTAVMAKGKHPVPFRTRKLSSSAPMVLRGGPRGRVGRRRTSFAEGWPKFWGQPSALFADIIGRHFRRPRCCFWGATGATGAPAGGITPSGQAHACHPRPIAVRRASGAKDMADARGTQAKLRPSVGLRRHPCGLRRWLSYARPERWRQT